MLLIDNPIIDFQQVNSGTPVTLAFNIQNIGQDIITIEIPIKSSCGCSTPILQKATFEPNEKQTMIVLFDTLGKAGFQTKQIFIDYNYQGNTYRATCSFRGRVNK